MTGEPFEYAIKKDVRNNPIVREIDRERHRELWRSTLVGLFVVAVLVFSVWPRIELLEHRRSQARLQRELAKDERTQSQLRARADELRSPKRVEREARERLGMIAPRPEDQEVIPRVTPSTLPPETAVASRQPHGERP
jgi:cell division protein FtsL